MTAPSTYASPSGLKIITGEARSNPFVATGTVFVSRELVGDVYFLSDIFCREGFE